MKKVFTLAFSFFAFIVPLFADSASDYVPVSSQCFRFGYAELTDTEKSMYDYMLGEFLEFQSNAEEYNDVLVNRVYFNFASIGVYPSDFDEIWNEVTRLLTLLYRDVPELYIMYSSVYRYDYGKYMYYGRVPKLKTPEDYLSELKQCDAAYKSIVSTITPDMSDYEKALILHDQFIDWSDYGGMYDADAGNIKGSFIKKKAVCEGFSRAYLYLCQRVGLKCIYVSGSLKTSDDPESWGNHAWNYVQINGVWYLVDITTDGAFYGQCGHSAFLKGADYFNANYRLTSVDGSNENVNQYSYSTLPTISATDYAPATSVGEEKPQSKEIVSIYNLVGMRLNALSRGLNIVYYSDGTSEKVIMR